jgi:hypothetical protein
VPIDNESSSHDTVKEKNLLWYELGGSSKIPEPIAKESSSYDIVKEKKRLIIIETGLGPRTPRAAKNNYINVDTQ